MRLMILCLLWLNVVLIGCGASGSSETQSTYDSQTSSSAIEFGNTSVANEASNAFNDDATTNRKMSSSKSSDTLNTGDHDKGPEGNAAITRKIIYRAELYLVVDDLPPISSKMLELARFFDGFLATEKLDQSKGHARNALWVARIPASNYDAFLESVAKLGTLENKNQTADDVTEQYVDLVARISNAKRLETRVLELLERDDAEIKSVIAIEAELARVRGEIETMEGKVRLLNNQAKLTTITIHVREEKNYFPEQSTSFLSQMSTRWQGSLAAAFELGRNMVLFLVSIAPGLLICLFSIGCFVLVRRLRRKKRFPSNEV